MLGHNEAVSQLNFTCVVLATSYKIVDRPKFIVRCWLGPNCKLSERSLSLGKMDFICVLLVDVYCLIGKMVAHKQDVYTCGNKWHRCSIVVTANWSHPKKNHLLTRVIVNPPSSTIVQLRWASEVEYRCRLQKQMKPIGRLLWWVSLDDLPHAAR